MELFIFLSVVVLLFIVLTLSYQMKATMDEMRNYIDRLEEIIRRILQQNRYD